MLMVKEHSPHKIHTFKSLECCIRDTIDLNVFDCNHLCAHLTMIHINQSSIFLWHPWWCLRDSPLQLTGFPAEPANLEI